MWDITDEQRRFVNLLRSVGAVKDYPAVRREAELLDHSTLGIITTEKHKVTVEHFEQLPGLLKKLKDRARREDKKDAYERLIAAVEGSDFSTLVAILRYWDKSKVLIHNTAGYIEYGDEQIRAFSALPNSPVDHTAVERFVAKAQEILPQPKIAPKDYEVLLQEFDTVLANWRKLASHPDRKIVKEVFLRAEGMYTDLYVLSLLVSVGFLT